MTTVAPPKTAIDPELENGAPALAEEMLPPNPERTENALALQRAERRYKDTRRRVESAITRQDEIAELLRAGPGDKERVAIAAERQALAAELAFAPQDVADAAQDYADKLTAWAPGVIRGAKAIVHQVQAEVTPLRRERARLLQKIDIDVPVMNRLEPAAAEKVRADRKKLWDRIAPLLERGQLAEDLASRARSTLTQKFDSGYMDQFYAPSGPRRWVDGVRDSVRKKTTKHTGIAEALRPRSL